MTIEKLPFPLPADKIRKPTREEVKKTLDNYKKQKKKDKSKDKSQQNKIPNKLMDRMRNMPPKKSGAGYSGSY